MSLVTRSGALEAARAARALGARMHRACTEHAGAPPTLPRFRLPRMISRAHTQLQLNPTKPRPSQTQSNRTKPNQTQPHLNRFNRTQSNPTYRAKPNQIHQDITQSYTSLNSPTQPGTTFDHPTRQRLHTALRNPTNLKQFV